MSDLRLDGVRMRELFDHLLERERAMPFFYCDDHKLVTIAIGFLVDVVGGADNAGRLLARQLANRPGVVFTAHDGSRASADDVESDWQRVKTFGRGHGGTAAPDYAKVAQLRIGQGAMCAITESVLSEFLAQLYAKRPFIMRYDPRVAMALVDVRYNSAGVALYSSHGPAQQIWNALDPQSPSYSPTRALAQFQQIWAHRATPRYRLRHAQRVQWMRAGLLATGELSV